MLPPRQRPGRGGSEVGGGLRAQRVDVRWGGRRTMAGIFREGLFKGKVALITGGGTGLGFGMAKCFVAAGAKVIMVGRRKEELEKAREDRKNWKGLGEHANLNFEDEIKKENQNK